MFENRTYRRFHQKENLVSFEVTVKETNLNIQADTDLRDAALRAELSARSLIENTIAQYPEFATSLVPLNETGPVPKIIDDMLAAGRLAGVGPMAAVAGAVAQYTGEALLNLSNEVIVENGGDIYIKSNSDTVLGIYAGENSPFSHTTGIRVSHRKNPFGICTSSGTLGHSKSFGTADAAIVLSHACPLADAAATALGNLVKSGPDIAKAIEIGRRITGIQGIVILKDDKIGVWGDIKLVKT